MPSRAGMYERFGSSCGASGSGGPERPAPTVAVMAGGVELTMPPL